MFETSDLKMENKVFFNGKVCFMVQEYIFRAKNKIRIALFNITNFCTILYANNFD